MVDGGFQAVVSAGTGAGLASAIAAGGKVSIGPGTFLLDSAIPLVGSLEIQGAGPGKTILKHSGTTLHTLFSGTSISKVTIRDLTLDGDQANVSTYDADRWAREPAIDLSAVTDLFISNVEMTAHRGQAIYGTGCSRVRIEGCWIHDTDNWGSIFKATDDIAYSNNHVENVYTHGLYVDGYNSSNGSRRIKFIGNSVINSQFDAAHAASGVGISVQVGSTGGVVDVECVGNICKDNGSMGFSMTAGGLAAGYDGRMVIADNISSGHTAQSGIGFETIGRHVVLSGNIAKNNKYHFTFQDSNAVVCTGNRTLSAFGSTQIAFIFTPASVSAQVEQFLLHGNVIEGGTGFQIDTTAAPHKDVVIADNHFLGCEYCVLTQTSNVNRIVIRGNYMDCTAATLGRGIQTYGSLVVIEGNSIAAKSNRDAITIASGFTTPAAVIRDNTITAGDYAFAFSGAVTTLHVSGNYVSGTTTAIFKAKNVVTNCRDGGDNSWNFAAAAPTGIVDHYHVGQKVYDTAVAASGNIGWVCTTAGAPGTWKTWGAVAA